MNRATCCGPACEVLGFRRARAGGRRGAAKSRGPVQTRASGCGETRVGPFLLARLAVAARARRRHAHPSIHRVAHDPSRSAASPLCRTHARLALAGFLSLSLSQTRPKPRGPSRLGSQGRRAVPLLLLLLQRPLGPLLVEPYALERSLLGGSAAVEVEARVGELLEELGLQHRQADDAAGGLGVARARSRCTQGMSLLPCHRLQRRPCVSCGVGVGRGSRSLAGRARAGPPWVAHLLHRVKPVLQLLLAHQGDGLASPCPLPAAWRPSPCRIACSAADA